MFVISCLLLHGVFTLMQFCVDPVLAMPYCSRLVCGWTLHVFLVCIKFTKFSKLSSLLVVFKVLVLDPNRQRPCCKLKVMPPKLVVAVASDLWTGLLFLQLSPAWPPAPWLQQYVVLHQVVWCSCSSLFHLGNILPMSFF